MARHFPENTFIHDYMTHMETVETAYVYDLWCALWLLSLACGRNVIVDRPRAPVFLNSYVILAADSGVTRKSTAVKMARDVAKEFNTALQAQDQYYFIENKSTPEAVRYVMKARSSLYGRANIAVCVSEMIDYFGKEKYTMAMPGFMTDMYDCPAERMGGGTLNDVRNLEQTIESPIKNVYMCMLTASTPAWLMRAINPDVIEGGFTSRAIFAVSEERKRAIAWPSALQNRQDRGYNERLLSIQRRAKSYGAITLQPLALKTFSDWYRQRYTYRDPYRASFDSREDAHILRVAALLAANDGTWRISGEHIRLAIRIIGLAKQSGASLFEGVGQKTNLMIGLDKIRDILLASGTHPVKRSFILFKVQKYMNANELTSALDVLHELDMIQKFRLETDLPGRPASLYRGTKALVSKGAIQNVLEKLSDNDNA